MRSAARISGPDRVSLLELKPRLLHGGDFAIGPGKADLLDAILTHGSISAAARALGMSYRRAWLLVEVMNRCWAQPLVETMAGGAHGGGTQLTDTGVTVLAAYRALTAQLEAAGEASAALAALSALLRPLP
jgi:molybdate transport system regulatory protein